jgi:hypothetical protein
LTCPNKACGKVFTKPLTTSNLQQGSKEPYYACPYCLTKLSTGENESPNSTEKIAIDVEPSKEKPSQNQETIISCKYHIGYLSERPQKQQIPEECMLCSEVVKCLMKNSSLAPP